MKDIISANEIDLSRENDGYKELLADIRRSFDNHIKNGSEPLFTTNATGLYDMILAALPTEARQHYNCRTCRNFVDRYGGLVRIDDNGNIQPVMWDYTPAFFEKAVASVLVEVENAKVTGVFVTDQRRLGTPKTGSWTHMAVGVPKKMIYTSRVKSAYQQTAEKAEDFRMLTSAISKYRKETVETALKLLRSESLYRSEKVLGVAEWFLGVLNDTERKRSNRRTNIVWKKAATAPVGFCHVSSSMIGTLLDDIEAGYDFDDVSRRFSEKMNPLQYQRPQAAPSVGNVAQAEKLVAKLGIENSLKRRFARLDELQTVWLPRPAKQAATTGGVFAGIQTKQSTAKRRTNDVAAPAVEMTWEKFQRTVLPDAQKIEFHVTAKNESYSAIVTAADPYAPPIIQWDSEDERNPFNWYVYSGGSAPGNWGLSMGWAEVTGVVLQPNLWKPGFEHQGKSVFFILKGCKDHRYRNSGAALFPEVLKADLREVRSTIEAYSRKAVLEGYDEATACGIRLQGSSKWWDYTFRVTTDLGVTEYKLDRWD